MSGITRDNTGNTNIGNANAPLKERTVVTALTNKAQTTVNNQKLLFITASH